MSQNALHIPHRTHPVSRRSDEFSKFASIAISWVLKVSMLSRPNDATPRLANYVRRVRRLYSSRTMCFQAPNAMFQNRPHRPSKTGEHERAFQVVSAGEYGHSRHRHCTRTSYTHPRSGPGGGKRKTQRSRGPGRKAPRPDSRTTACPALGAPLSVSGTLCARGMAALRELGRKTAVQERKRCVFSPNITPFLSYLT